MTNAKSSNGRTNGTAETHRIFVGVEVKKEDAREIVQVLSEKISTLPPKERSGINFTKADHITFYDQDFEQSVVAYRVELGQNGELSLEEARQEVEKVYDKSKEGRQIDSVAKLTEEFKIFGSSKNSFLVRVVKPGLSSKKKISLHNFISNFRQNMSPNGMYQGKGGVPHVTQAKVSDSNPSRLKRLLSILTHVPETTINVDTENPIIEISKSD